MRHAFHTPLARYGFTACALLATTTGQPWPALIAGTFAAHAWRTPNRRRRRTRSHP